MTDHDTRILPPDTPEPCEACDDCDFDRDWQKCTQWQAVDDYIDRLKEGDVRTFE